MIQIVIKTNLGIAADIMIGEVFEDADWLHRSAHGKQSQIQLEALPLYAGVVVPVMRYHSLTIEDAEILLVAFDDG